jgi:orotate phosphoribosyltransferase
MEGSQTKRVTTTKRRVAGYHPPAVAEDDRQRLLALLRERALSRESVKLASGRRSSFYIDARQVLLDPEGAALAGRLGHAQLADHTISAVGGLTLGADPLVCAISSAAWQAGQHWTGFLIRKEAKKHGFQQWLEGPFIEEGSPVAVVDDVLTSGGSLRVSLERARQAGGEVKAALVVVDREEDGGRAAVEADLDGAPLYSLFTGGELLDG